MSLKKNKLGLIIGNGDLAVYCMQQLLSKDYHLSVIRLPCCKINVSKDTECFDMSYEEIDQMFSFLKRNEINNLVIIGYVKRPIINIKMVSINARKYLLSLLPSLDRGDSVIFRSVKDLFKINSFHLLKIQELLPV